MFKKLKNIDVLIVDWSSIKKKILLIIGIIFFAGFTIGFGVGRGVENSLTAMQEVMQNGEYSTQK